MYRHKPGIRWPVYLRRMMACTMNWQTADGRRQTADGRRQTATGTKWQVSGNGAGRFAGASAARGVDHGLHQGVVQQAVELALLLRRLAGGFFAACLGHQGGQAEVGCLGVLIDEIGQ